MSWPLLDLSLAVKDTFGSFGFTAGVTTGVATGVTAGGAMGGAMGGVIELLEVERCFVVGFDCAGAMDGPRIGADGLVEHDLDVARTMSVSNTGLHGASPCSLKFP